MKISYKFTLGFLIISLLVCVVAYSGIIAINAINKANQELVDETLPVTETLNDLKFHGLRIVTSTHELYSIYSNTEANNSRLQDEFEQLKTGNEQFVIALERYKELTDKYFPGEKGYVSRINMTGLELQKTSSDMIALKEQNASGEKIFEKYEEFEDMEVKFVSAIDEAMSHEKLEISARHNELESTVSDVRKIIQVSSASTFIIALFAGIYLAGYFIRPIIRFRDASIEIGKGNLDTRIDINSKDEIEDLANSFNKMAADLKKSSSETISARKFMDNIISSMADLLIVVNRDMTIRKVNNAVLDLLAYQENELIGKPFDIIIRDDDSFKKGGIEEHVKSGIIKNVDKTYHAKDGRKIPVSFSSSVIYENGRVEAIVCVALDITERKKAEKAIIESNAMNMAILNAIPDMIFRLSEDGIILGFKPSKDMEMNNRPEEFLGKKINSIIPWELEGEILQKTSLSIQTGAPQELEYRLLVNDTVFEYEARLVPIENTEALCIIRDITDFKRAQELRLENEKLLRSSKAKSDFLATMSHELRTPLNSILGFSTLLEQSGQLNDKHKHYIENVIKSGRHLLGLIDDILDLSKVEAGKMELVIEKISVPAIINESVLSIKEKAARQNVKIRLDLDPQLNFIETDSMRFIQILFNLLTNAVKFSKPEGGTVTVMSRKEGEMASFSVSDTGIGIKEEDKVRLFMAFEQMDSGISRKYGGTGLGLAITKKILDIQGGRITVESKYGEGTTFTFYIPISRKEVMINE